MKRRPRRWHKPKQKQHVQLYRKAALRTSLLDEALPGAAYVPFIGDGDLAKLYHGRFAIFGADLDKARVRKAAERFPDALVVAADCNEFPFKDSGAVFSIGDFDAYADPYRAFESFWRSNARRAKRMVLFFTDDRRGHVRRFKVMRYPDGTKAVIESATQIMAIYRNYLGTIVFPWLRQLIEPWQLVTEKHYFRGAMTYWGGVIADARP